MKHFNWKIVALTKPEPKFDAIPICRFTPQFYYLVWLWTLIFICGVKLYFFLLLYHINQCKISATCFHFLSPSRHFVESSQMHKQHWSLPLNPWGTLQHLNFFKSNISEVLPHSANDFDCLFFFFFFLRQRNPWCSDKRWFHNTTSFTCCLEHILKLIKRIASSHVKISFANFTLPGSDF